MSINSSDGGIDQVVDRLLELAVMGRFAIYSDIDGTISPIAATPDAARLFPGAAEALRALRSRGIRVVAITGRAAEDARQLVGIDTLDYAGNHGFELLTADGRVVSEEVQSSVDAVEQALEDVRQVLEYLPDGLILENKVFTASIHYRLAPDRDVAALILRPLLESIALRRGVLITEGRLVFEIRPRLDVNKGVFTENDIRLHAITSAAFLGDDITDLDGFRALDRLVESGELLGAAKVAVVAEESPVIVKEMADLHVAGVSGMVDVLRALDARLSGWSIA